MSVNDYDEEFYEMIRVLVDRGDLDEKSRAYGIAMQVVDRGEGSLSAKQRYVYETEILSLLKKRAPLADYDPE